MIKPALQFPDIHSERKERVSYFHACNQDASTYKCTYGHFLWRLNALKLDSLLDAWWIQWTSSWYTFRAIQQRTSSDQSDFTKQNQHSHTDPGSGFAPSVPVFINMCGEAALIFRQHTCYCSICEHQSQLSFVFLTCNARTMRLSKSPE